MKEKKISLSIDSRLENVPLVSTAINNICAQIPITSHEAHAIELCVTEAVVNSIKHAYQEMPDQKVEIELFIYSKTIEINIIDFGKSMDPGLVKDKLVDVSDYHQDDLESLPSSGRGLMIIQNHMDLVSYRIEKSRNILTMKKKIITKGLGL
jgi:anti-sigma regulatory factor (Ser/Thr protein kinase)